MALNQSALLELTNTLRSADGGNMMRTLLLTILQALIDTEATEHIGAGHYQRADTRTTSRSGNRDKTVTTTSGDLTVKIPKLRTGSFFPSLLEPRRRIDVALHAVIMEAYVHGTSTRKVDDLVVALGCETGISKSEVSRICSELDEARAAQHFATPVHAHFHFADEFLHGVVEAWVGDVAPDALGSDQT